jgi:hypothetical protein
VIEQNLEPTPRGWIERAYDANVFTMLTVALLVLVLYPLNDKVGFWLSLVITALAVAAISVLVALPVIPLRRKRVAQDAGRGLFECAQREEGSSLKGRWAVGYAKAEPGCLLFQAKTGVTGTLAGPVEIYSAPRQVGEPVKAPWSAFPRGKVITLATDKGIVELAAAPARPCPVRARSRSVIGTMAPTVGHNCTAGLVSTSSWQGT